MALCRFIYGSEYLCNERVVHVHYVVIDDLVINDIAALWSCSGKAGASLFGQDVVASLLSLCMAKWLRKKKKKKKKKKPVKSLITQTNEQTNKQANNQQTKNQTPRRI